MNMTVGLHTIVYTHLVVVNKPCSAVPLYSRTVLLRAQTSAVSLQSARNSFQKHGKAVPPYVAAYAYEIPTTWQHTVPYQ